MEPGPNTPPTSEDLERVWDLPWTRLRGRRRAEIRVIAQRFSAAALILWISAAATFVAGALGLIPGFGPDQNVGLAILALSLAVGAIMASSVWTHMDNALHGEPRLDAKWYAWQSRGGRWRRLGASFGATLLAGLLLASLAVFGLRSSVPALLTTAGVLVLILLVLVMMDHRRRRMG